MNRYLSIPVLKCVVIAVVATGGAYGQNVSPTINDFATRQFGQSPNVVPLNQPTLSTSAGNLVEGRELNIPYAIAFDKTATPPILYIADTFNHRVLAFKNPNNMRPCGTNAPTCGVADLVIGQRDVYSTLQGGPGRPGLNYGFAFPTSVAVDSSGNLYVLDAGNNRILRFPSPFKQTVSPPTPDLTIGQKTSNNGITYNQGNPLPDATTLFFNNGGAIAPIGLAIQPNSGDLWVSDYGNNRVLRFPASVLTPNNNRPPADLVLGQSAMNVGQPPTTCTNQLSRGCLSFPTGLAFDNAGNLYISDNFSRVQYFLFPFQANGQNSNRVLGVCEPIAPITTAICQSTNSYGLGPTGLFSDGTHLFVADQPNHRIVEYDVPSSWPGPPAPAESPQTHQDSPPILAVFGQPDMASGKPNRAQPEPSASSFSQPLGGAFNGGDMWVVDTGNNRVVGFQAGTPGTSTLLIGQLDYPYFASNLIEGRELFMSNGGSGGDVAIDHSSNPPHLYIADTFNHRILGFNDARSVKPGQRADIVIGQKDFYRALINNPKNDSGSQQPTGLSLPAGVLVDPKDGSLWVADSGNSRVLRFPAPFVAANAAQVPNLVLGQQDFFSQTIDATQVFMRVPTGLALFLNGSIAVSDGGLNRILIFKRPAGGDFQNGQPAATVLGQSGFDTSQPSSSTAGLAVPRHMGTDSSDRLYVADSSNARLMIYNNPLTAANGTAASQVENLGVSPQGVVVSQNTGESWVALADGRLVRLPEYNALVNQSNPNAPPYTQTINLLSVPLAVTFDNSDNLIVAESANRVTFFYSKLTYQNAANYNGGDQAGNYRTPIAPGQLTSLYRLGKGFTLTDATATTDPWPTVMNDYQITVNGTPAHIFLVSSTGFISFQVPTNAPPSGTADFLLTHPSTGEVVGAGSFPMAQYNPGFFTQGAAGTGQAAAFNDDGSVNNTAHPVSRDGTHFISFCLTGGGLFDGGPNPPPADGKAPAPGQISQTHDVPTLISDSYPPNGIVPASAMVFSGAGCGFAGGWQVNFVVPSAVNPGVRTINISIAGINGGTGPGGSNTVHLTYVTK